jgi:transcriptional regulator, propionate catabolism operon regulatory protein
MASKICFISPSPESTALYKKALSCLSEPPMILEGAIQAAEAAALEALSRGYEILVTPEHNAHNLWGKLNTPIVAIPVHALDIGLSLHRAKTQYGEPVAFFGFREHFAHLSTLQEMIKCEFKEFVFRDEKEGRLKLRQALEEGFCSVVGGAIISPMAREMGIPCVPVLPSPEDILTAFQQAKNISTVRQIEQREAMKFEYVVQYSLNGIILADEENKITIFNSAAERILEMPANQALGRRLQEVVPHDQQRSVDEKEHPQLGELKTIRNKQLLVNTVPFVRDGKILGTIFMFKEASNIQSMEEKIRRASHAKGLTAKLTFEDIIGESRAIREAISQARRLSLTDETILVTGESGTGKEIFTQSIHNGSSRRAHPFVAINCSAIPSALLESELFGYAEGAFTGARRGGKQGVFELAHGGTIFLDEIGELSPEAQGHLLRVLQEKEVMRLGDGKVTPVDVRVIAATNRPLEKALHQGVFRWDLYYRLNVLQLRLPPLREHPEDILPLAGVMIARWCPDRKLAGQIADIIARYETLLANYAWPGNIRELQNILKRVIALVGTATEISIEQEIKDLLTDTFTDTSAFIAPMRKRKNAKLKTTVADFERELIHEYHKKLSGNKTELAKKLGIGRTTLWRKLNQEK